MVGLWNSRLLLLGENHVILNLDTYLMSHLCSKPIAFLNKADDLRYWSKSRVSSASVDSSVSP